MVITSSKNESIKIIKKLKTERGFLFLDNPKIILEAVKSGYDIEWVIYNENFKNAEIENIYAKNKVVVTQNVFKTLASTVSSQGVVAIIQFIARKFKPPSGNFLVLDNVQDPGNVGTLIRSAAAFNFNDVYLIDCAKISNEKVARSSMGALFITRLYEISKETFLFNFKNYNLICGACGGKPLHKEEAIFPVGVVVGNEGKGICKEIMMIGKEVEIEMNENVESLNAGVAGSILMNYYYNKKL